MKILNDILNDNIDDKKWNFTKNLIKKALESNGKIFAQDHTYIEDAFDITSEIKKDTKKELSNIFDDNEELSVNYIFYDFYTTFFHIVIYTEIDFIYFVEIPCVANVVENVNFNKVIRVLCDKTPNKNVAIATQKLNGERKYYKNC